MLSELPVFTGVSITYDSCQDSSLPLRMTAAGGGERIIRHAFQTAGIYRRPCHLRFLPRFFAGSQNDRRGEEKESFGMLSGLPVFTGISVTYDSYQDSSLALRMTGVERRKNHSACFPNCRYLPAVLSLTMLTKILRWRSVFWSYVKSFF